MSPEYVDTWCDLDKILKSTGALVFHKNFTTAVKDFHWENKHNSRW
jgi:hypothetical protein